LARLEDLHGDPVAHRVAGNLRVLARSVIQAEAAKQLRRSLQARLLRMTHLGTAGEAAASDTTLAVRLTTHPLLAIAELHRSNAALRTVQHLRHRIRRRRELRAGNLLPRFVEYLGHAQLLPNDADHPNLFVSQLPG